MEDYAKFVLDRARIAARAPTQVAEEPVKPPPPPPLSRPRVPTGTARRRAEAAEAALGRATSALAELDALLTDPAVFAKDPAKAADLGRRRDAAQVVVDAAEAEWLAAQEAYEALTAES
jgi:ATP-binding cassette subfamily F protein 3